MDCSCSVEDVFVPPLNLGARARTQLAKSVTPLTAYSLLAEHNSGTAPQAPPTTPSQDTGGISSPIPHGTSGGRPSSVREPALVVGSGSGYSNNTGSTSTPTGLSGTGEAVMGPGNIQYVTVATGAGGGGRRVVSPSTVKPLALTMPDGKTRVFNYGSATQVSNTH